jgi:hypothetical protein
VIVEKIGSDDMENIIFEYQFVISNSSFDLSKVFMLRKVNAEWIKLDTKAIKNEEYNFSYISLSPGFSYFVIGVPKTNQINTDSGILKESQEVVPQVNIGPQVKENSTINSSDKTSDLQTSSFIFIFNMIIFFLVACICIILLFYKTLHDIYLKNKDNAKMNIYLETKIKELENWEDLAMQKGLKKEDLINVIKKSGWPEDLIERSLKNLEKKKLKK